MSRLAAILIAVSLVGCTQYQYQPAEAAAAAAAALDAFGFEAHSSYVTPIGTPAVNTARVSITTQSPNRMVVVIAGMNSWNAATITLADSSGLTWHLLGTQTTNEQDVAEGTDVLSAWYAFAPTALNNDTITATYSSSSGASLAAWAFSGATAPTGIVKVQDPTPSVPQATLTAPLGSYLLGASIDVAGGINYTVLANTSYNSIDAFADNQDAFWWTTVPTTSATTIFGMSGPSARDFGALALVVSPADGGTDAGTPDAGQPDAGSDGGTCTWVCQ